MSTSGAEAVAVVAGGATVGAILALAAIAHRPAAPLRARGLRRPTRRAARRRRPVTVAIAIVGTLLAWLVAGAPATIVGVCGVPLAIAVLRRRRAAAVRRAIEVAVPDAIELVVVSIHAGLAPARAIDAGRRYVAPAVRPGFEAVHRQVHRGRPLAEALGELPRVLGPTTRELATAIAAADRDGLPLAPVLDRLAAAARAERRRQAEAAARRLPVQLSFPLVVCTLPSFVLLTIAPAVLGAISTLRGSAP